MFPEAGNGTKRAGIASFECHLTSHLRFGGGKKADIQRNECQHVGGRCGSIELAAGSEVTSYDDVSRARGTSLENDFPRYRVSRARVKVGEVESQRRNA